jgi:hypothetical protein
MPSKSDFRVFQYQNYGTCMSTPTLRSEVILEKLAVAQLVKKFPSFYGTRSFMTVHNSLPTVIRNSSLHHT